MNESDFSMIEPNYIISQWNNNDNDDKSIEDVNLLTQRINLLCYVLNLWKQIWLLVNQKEDALKKRCANLRTCVLNQQIVQHTYERLCQMTELQNKYVLKLYNKHKITIVESKHFS